MAVGAVMCQPDRNPCRLAEKRTFRPHCSISGIGTGCLTAKRRLPDCPVAGKPVPSRSRPAHGSQAAPAARSPGTPWPAPTPGSDGAPKTRNRSRSRSTRSTASPSAARAGSRPSRPGRAHAAGDSPTRCAGGAGSNGSTRSHSQSCIRQPSSLETRPIEALPRRLQQRGRTSLSQTGSLPSGIGLRLVRWLRGTAALGALPAPVVALHLCIGAGRGAIHDALASAGAVIGTAKVAHKQASAGLVAADLVVGVLDDCGCTARGHRAGKGRGGPGRARASTITGSVHSPSLSAGYSRSPAAVAAESVPACPAGGRGFEILGDLTSTVGKCGFESRRSRSQECLQIAVGCCLFRRGMPSPPHLHHTSRGL